MSRPERRRAVDEDEVVVVAHLVERLAQAQLPAERRHQLDLGAGQVEAGRGAEQVAHRGGLHAVLDREVVEDHVVHRAVQVPDVDAEAGAGVALRVEVDDEHPVAEVGQAGPEVHGRGGLADAALLVGDGQDPGERPGERRAPSSASSGSAASSAPAAPRASGLLQRDVDRGRLEVRRSPAPPRPAVGRSSSPGSGPRAGGSTGSGRSGGGGRAERLQLLVGQHRRTSPASRPARPRPPGVGSLGRFRRGCRWFRDAGGSPPRSRWKMARPREARSSCDSVTAASCPVRSDGARTVRDVPRETLDLGSTLARPRCSTWNTERRSEQGLLGRAGRRGGGRPSGHGVRCSSTWTAVPSTTRSTASRPRASQARRPASGRVAAAAAAR